MEAVFDRPAVRRHRDRASAKVALVQDILDEAATRLLDRLDDTTVTFREALDVGGRGAVAARLRARGLHVVASDLSASMAAVSGQPSVAADEELLPFRPAAFDLIVANLSLHWVNDLPGALIQLRRALRPDGLFLASMPTLGTLQELRHALAGAESDLSNGASPRVSPFPELRDCVSLLQRAGFKLPIVDADEIVLRYADPLGLLRDLRHAGETNAVMARDKHCPPRLLFPKALAALPRTDGRAAVSLRLAMMTAWG
jgi:SAM-dependent methyltransferase